MTRKRAPKHRRRARPPYPIFWTARTLADLAIGDYIARDDPAVAGRWVTRLISLAEKIAAAPLAGRRVPELARDDVREVSLRSYRLVYRLTQERVEMLTVFEGHRLFPNDVVSGREQD